MMPVQFGAGRIVVDPSYFRRNDAHTVADTADIVDQWREAVPDGVTITLYSTPKEDPLRDYVQIEGEMGNILHQTEAGKPLGMILDEAVTEAIGETNIRKLWRTSPDDAVEIYGERLHDHISRLMDEDAGARGWSGRLFDRLFGRALNG